VAGIGRRSGVVECGEFACVRVRLTDPFGGLREGVKCHGAAAATTAALLWGSERACSEQGFTDERRDQCFPWAHPRCAYK
jgi:hypothetical protein